MRDDPLSFEDVISRGAVVSSATCDDLGDHLHLPHLWPLKEPYLMRAVELAHGVQERLLSSPLSMMLLQLITAPPTVPSKKLKP